MYHITEEMRQQILQCIAGATHTTLPFHVVNSLLVDLNNLKPEAGD